MPRKNIGSTLIIERYFDNLPIVEATKEMDLRPATDDFDTATRHDPRHCGFANCIMRVALSPKALFFKTTAYVAMRNAKGVLEVVRYSVSEPLRRALEAYDRTGRYPKIGTPYKLLPIAKSKTRKVMNQQFRAWRESDMGQAREKLYNLRKQIQTAEADVEREKRHVERVTATAGNSPRAAEARKRLAVAKTILRDKRDAFTAQRETVEELAQESSYGGTGKVEPRVIDTSVRYGVASLVEAIKKDPKGKAPPKPKTMKPGKYKSFADMARSAA